MRCVNGGERKRLDKNKTGDDESRREKKEGFGIMSDEEILTFSYVFLGNLIESFIIFVQFADILYSFNNGSCY